MADRFAQPQVCASVQRCHAFFVALVHEVTQLLKFLTPFDNAPDLLRLAKALGDLACDLDAARIQLVGMVTHHLMQRLEIGQEAQRAPGQNVSGANATRTLRALEARRLAIRFQRGQRAEATPQRLLHGRNIVARLQAQGRVLERFVDDTIGLRREMLADSGRPQQRADQGGADRPQPQFRQSCHGDVEDLAGRAAVGDHHDQHRGDGCHQTAIGIVVAPQRADVGAQHDP